MASKDKIAKIDVHNNSIELSLPLTSQGKFRCKKRKHCQDFGNGFAPKSSKITSDAYLEWQIGYDTFVNGDKETSLNKEEFTFIGANKKKKYPYELSEILYYMCTSGIISKSDLETVRARIASNSSFFQDEYKISPEAAGSIDKNGLSLLRSYTKLPTFLWKDEASHLQIETMIQKQQYATGVQPMVYLNVPMTAFDNSQAIIGHTSTETPNGKIKITAKHKNLILSLLVCFGMCSTAHNHDILSIIDVIKKNAF